MTEARYQHSFSLNEQDEKILQDLIAKGIEIIEIVRLGMKQVENKNGKK